MTDFVIKSQKISETASGEKLMSIVYNHNRQGVSLEAMKVALANTLKDVPNDSSGKPYEYKITTITSVGTRSGKHGWYVFDPSEPKHINIYNPSEVYEVDVVDVVKYHSAIIMLRKQKEMEGGDDEKNDCLFYALKEAGLTLPWKYPGFFKAFLKLERCDKVPLSKLSKLEEKLRVVIKVSGDYTHCSGQQYAKTVHLKIENGHYTAHKSTAAVHKSMRGKIHKSKTKYELLIYKQECGKMRVMAADRTSTLIEVQEFYTLYTASKTSKQYCCYIVREVSAEMYDKILKEIEELEAHKIHVLKFQNIKNAVLHSLYYSSLKNYEVDDLCEVEAEFLDKAFSGGIIHREPGTYHNVNYFDINSHYPNILKNTGILFPTGKPTFERLTELKEFPSFGVYRAVVNAGKKTTKFLFRLKSTNHYTHYELSRAKELNYSIELIQDGQANAMLYAANARTPAKSIFKDYITKFYAIKKETKNSVAKTFLNLIWGALCQKDKVYTNIENSSNSNLHITHTHKNGRMYVEQYKNAKLFKYSYARIGAFLTAYGRCSISKTIEPFIDNVRRVHTDGFLLDDGVFPETGKEMGELKLEYSHETLEV